MLSLMDLNQDGYDDIVIGAKNNCEAGYAAGKIYIYFGCNPMDTLPDCWVHGESSNLYVGNYPLGWCGYKRGGYIAFSTPDYPGGYFSGIYNGKAYLLKGGAGMDSIPDLTMVGVDTFTELGRATAAFGFLGTDTLGELGVSLFNPTTPYYPGQGNIYTGKATMTQEVSGYIRGRWANDWVVNMGRAGDVAGDGKEEALFANASADSNRTVWLCRYTGPDGATGRPFETVDVPGLKLFQNVPNPFKQLTMIKYQITKSEMVSLKVYNIAGQLMKTLLDGNQTGGVNKVQWDGRNEKGQVVSGGIYFYKLKSGGQTCIKKMILLR